jgi:hypothetical protein
VWFPGHGVGVAGDAVVVGLLVGLAVTAAVGDRALDPPTVGRTVRVTVAERRTLDAGGILPLALGMPIVVGLAAGGMALRRRRLVSAA